MASRCLFCGGHGAGALGGISSSRFTAPSSSSRGGHAWATFNTLLLWKWFDKCMRSTTATTGKCGSCKVIFSNAGMLGSVLGTDVAYGLGAAAVFSVMLMFNPGANLRWKTGLKRIAIYVCVALCMRLVLESTKLLFDYETALIKSYPADLQSALRGCVAKRESENEEDGGVCVRQLAELKLAATTGDVPLTMVKLAIQQSFIDTLIVMGLACGLWILWWLSRTFKEYMNAPPPATPAQQPAEDAGDAISDSGAEDTAQDESRLDMGSSGAATIEAEAEDRFRDLRAQMDRIQTDREIKQAEVDRETDVEEKRKREAELDDIRQAEEETREKMEVLARERRDPAQDVDVDVVAQEEAIENDLKSLDESLRDIEDSEQRIDAAETDLAEKRSDVNAELAASNQKLTAYEEKQNQLVAETEERKQELQALDKQSAEEQETIREEKGKAETNARETKARASEAAEKADAARKEASAVDDAPSDEARRELASGADWIEISRQKLATLKKSLPPPPKRTLYGQPLTRDQIEKQEAEWAQEKEKIDRLESDIAAREETQRKIEEKVRNDAESKRSALLARARTLDAEAESARADADASERKAEALEVKAVRQKDTADNRRKQLAVAVRSLERDMDINAKETTLTRALRDDARAMNAKLEDERRRIVSDREELKSRVRAAEEAKMALSSRQERLAETRRKTENHSRNIRDAKKDGKRQNKLLGKLARKADKERKARENAQSELDEAARKLQDPSLPPGEKAVLVKKRDLLAKKVSAADMKLQDIAINTEAAESKKAAYQKRVAEAKTMRNENKVEKKAEFALKKDALKKKVATVGRGLRASREGVAKASRSLASRIRR